MGRAFPMSYFVPISVGTFTKGLGFLDLGADLAALAVFVPVLTLLNGVDGAMPFRAETIRGYLQQSWKAALERNPENEQRHQGTSTASMRWSRPICRCCSRSFRPSSWRSQSFERRSLDRSPNADISIP